MYYIPPEVYEFISQQTGDPIIERRACRISGTKFPIFQSDKEFYEKISPTFGGKKYLIPFPTLCPEERTRRRMMWKNDRNYYRTTCALTGESIITTYDPERWSTIYSTKSWWSDAWDPLEYGQDIDFTQGFFEQYSKLLHAVPKIALMNDNGTGSENCEYTQNLAYSKDCYLTTVSWKLENCHYDDNMAGGRWLIDNLFVMDSENCYQCVDSYNLHTCFWLQNSHDCFNCRFGEELHGCKDCIMCVGLQNQQYCIHNKQYTKEEFDIYMQKFRQQLQQESKSLREEFTIFVKQFPKKNMHLVRADHLTFGSNLINAEKSINSYNVKNIRFSKHCIFGDTLENAHDLTTGGELQWCYEGIVPDHSYHTCFSIFCRSCSNVRYSEMCHHCQDCFGCVGLKNKSYCIFNKQYTKEEYNELVPKIIEHMKKPLPNPLLGGEGTSERGEFFPARYSPYAYNETNAYDYFPLSREEIQSLGYMRYERKKEIDIPDDIDILSSEQIQKYNQQRFIPDDICDKAISCEISGRLFKLIPPEIQFYHKYSLPLPTRHPNIRVKERIARSPDKTLYLRKCDKCGKEMVSVYMKSDEEHEVGGKKQLVYCEECYRKEVYG